MPVTYKVGNGGSFVHTKATGKVTEEDLLNCQAAVLSDPQVKPGFYELFDATMAQGVGLSEAVIDRMMEVDKAHAEKLRGGKCAVVVRTEFELAERFERSHGGPQDVMVFFNLDIARAWLGEKAKLT